MLNLASIMGQPSSFNQNTFKVKIEGTRGRVKKIIQVKMYDFYVLEDLILTGQATKKERSLFKKILNIQTRTIKVLDLNNI